MTKKPSVPERLRRQVQERAQGRCEYCLIHEADMYYPHEPDNELIEAVLKLKYIQPPPPLPLQSSTRWGVVMLPGRSKGAFLVGRGESCPFPATSSFEGQACKIASH